MFNIAYCLKNWIDNNPTYTCCMDMKPSPPMQSEHSLAYGVCANGQRILEQIQLLKDKIKEDVIAGGGLENLMQFY